MIHDCSGDMLKRTIGFMGALTRVTTKEKKPGASAVSSKYTSPIKRGNYRRNVPVVNKEDRS